jgi:hypothetical protein
MAKMEKAVSRHGQEISKAQGPRNAGIIRQSGEDAEGQSQDAAIVVTAMMLVKKSWPKMTISDQSQ